MTDKASLILLVDDDIDFLESQRTVLESAGYRVIATDDPSKAQQLARTERPDLIITDLMMRDLDSGFSLSRRIKNDPELKLLPIILVTAASSARGFDFRPRQPEDLAAMHADAYFDKPVPTGELLAKVAELLARPNPSV